MCWLQLSAQLWHYPTFLLPPLMLIACVECFAGYRAWRFLIGLNGAVLGFVAGAMLCVLVGAPMLVLIGAFVGGVAGILLFAGVVPLGSFVCVLGTMVSLVMILGRAAGLSPHWVMPVAALAGLGCAVAATTLWRPVVILVTAVAGAQQVASAWCAYHLASDRIPSPDVVDPKEWMTFLVLAAAGLAVQFATPRRVLADQAADAQVPAADMPRSHV